MGMFDYVIVETELPDGFISNDSFQTKSMDCVLQSFKITKDGRLYFCSWSGAEWREYHEHTGDKFHGILNFYTSQDGKWHEYNAKFTDGQLVEIKIDEEMTKRLTERIKASEKLASSNQSEQRDQQKRK